MKPYDVQQCELSTARQSPPVVHIQYVLGMLTMLSLCRIAAYAKISSVLQEGATRDENIDALVARYGTQAHPDHHQSVCSNSEDRTTQGCKDASNKDASTHNSNKLKTNNENKSDWTNQG